MIDERMKEVLERTQKTLCRHLEDLNDQVERDGGRIKDHMALDGMKDSLEGLDRIKSLLGSAGGETAVAKALAKTAPAV